MPDKGQLQEVLRAGPHLPYKLLSIVHVGQLLGPSLLCRNSVGDKQVCNTFASHEIQELSYNPRQFKSAP